MWRYRLELMKPYRDLVGLWLGLIVLALGAAYWQSSTPLPPATVERGMVLRFASVPDREGDRLEVVVRGADGSVLQLPTALAYVHNCRVGEAIMLLRRGGRISGLSLPPCRVREDGDPR